MIWTISFRKIDILTPQQSSMLSIMSENTSAIFFTCDTWSICIFVSAPEYDCSSGMSFWVSDLEGVETFCSTQPMGVQRVEALQKCRIAATSVWIDPWPGVLCCHAPFGFVDSFSCLPPSIPSVRATCSFSCLTRLTLQRSCIVLISRPVGQLGKLVKLPCQLWWIHSES